MFGPSLCTRHPRRSGLVAVLAVWAVAATLPACGSDTGGSGAAVVPTGGASGGGSSSGGSSSGGSSPGTAADFKAMGEQAATAMCDLMVKCQTKVVIVAFGTTAGCQSLFDLSTNVETDPTYAAIKDGTAVYDKGKGAACLAALKNSKCSDGSSSFEAVIGLAAASCDGVVSGTLAVGASCTHSDTCKDGYCKLDPAKDGCPGVCAANPVKDESCTSSAPCAPGLVCRGAKCSDKQKGASGDACGESAPCDAGLLCAKNKCAGGGKDGEACVDDECQPGLVCDGATDKCALAVAEGQVCKAAGFGGSNCAQTLDCVADKCLKLKKIGGTCADSKECFGIDTECKAGVCAAIPISAKGGPCKPADFAAGSLFAFGCQYGLVCDGATKTCADLPSAGQPCAASGDKKCAAGLGCVTDGAKKTCVPLAKDGEACGDTVNPKCVPGLTCQQGKCATPKCG